MKLQFTNGYRPRFDQISRILQFLLTQDGSIKIPRKEMASPLGIPHMQIKNYTSMMIGFGLVNPRIGTITDLGHLLLKEDPYFDRLESLWIIHYVVSSNPEWIVWYRIINSVFRSQDSYEVQEICQQYFSDLGSLFSKQTIAEKLPREVRVVLEAYGLNEFSRLHIIEGTDTGAFVKTEPTAIPPLVLLFCIYKFREVYSPGSSAMSISDMCTIDRSPGKVLNLPENQLRLIIETLHDAGMVRLELNANLNQMRFLDSVSLIDILRKIYEGS